MKDKLLNRDNITIENNLSLIVIIDTYNKNIKPYYHAILKDTSGNVYIVFIDAYNDMETVNT